MKTPGERISHVRRPQQVALRALNHGVAQISRPEMDAFKQPFDHDAIVGLRKVVVRGDELQPTWAVLAGLEIDVLREQRDRRRRDRR
jgi:hypothetical protein